MANKKNNNKTKEYDLIILGTGPAGLSAAIYAARYKLKTLVIGKEIGGHALETLSIENYPGFKEISGPDLSEKFKEQVKALGVDILDEEVKEAKKIGREFEIKTENAVYKSKTLILALGSKRRKLNVKGEAEFARKGVVYCVTCDAPLFKDKDIAIIGGGDSAVESALFMLKYANKVYVVDVEKQSRAKPYWLDKLLEEGETEEGEKRVELINNHKVNEIKGNKLVSSIEIENIDTKKKREFKVQGVIVEIGMEPLTELAKKLGVKLDEKGFIMTNNEMKTNMPGIFAAGDCTVKPLRQIVTAVSDGAIAAYSAYEYLKQK